MDVQEMVNEISTNGKGKPQSTRIGNSRKFPKHDPADDFHDDGVIHGNGVNPETIQSYVARIEKLHGDLATERSESMTRCKPSTRTKSRFTPTRKKTG